MASSEYNINSAKYSHLSVQSPLPTQVRRSKITGPSYTILLIYILCIIKKHTKNQPDFITCCAHHRKHRALFNLPPFLSDLIDAHIYQLGLTEDEANKKLTNKTNPLNSYLKRKMKQTE